VKYGNFFQLSPPSLAKQGAVSKQGADSKKPPGKEQSEGTKKKKEFNNVVNKSPIPEFKILPSETWFNNFAKKSEGRVQRDNKCQMCSRWWIMGQCYSDCRNPVSHVPKEEVPEEKFTKFEVYLKLCCLN
jgi:hypothetical protein